MQANVFITKLKADGSKYDVTDLDEVSKEYTEILTKLASKDRGPFSLNILCILCRNLEKVPAWCSMIDNQTLITLSLECLNQTQTLNAAEQVKTLACVYHIHRHVVRQTSPIHPELILKLSYLPFQRDALITEYCKTYWNILADRITYLEKLKAKKMNIQKCFQMLAEDVLKVVKIYSSVQFCLTILMYLVKKLLVLFSELDAKELDKLYGKIFDEMQQKTDLRSLKKLQDSETFDLYVKLNDCLYVVAENSSKVNFSGSALTTAIQFSISVLGHQQDLLHCLQSIYLNGINTILNESQSSVYKETILTSFVTSCETAEKLGYKKAMKATYPYVNQLLRLYIEFNVSNQNWQTSFPEQMQIACLNLMEFLLVKLKDCNQILKCENCLAKSGLHDALRLSFLVKNFITVPLQENLGVTKIFPIHFSITQHQYVILNELCVIGCVNYDKCYRKLQTDIHNTAILLNKSQNFEYSIKLFEVYLKNEILHFKSDSDFKNISRAFYNKSICELDFKQYENGLLDAYLSLIFAYPDGLTTEKHMSIVMDIKAKLLKSTEVDSEMEAESDYLQMMTVLDACTEAIDKKKYGNLKPFFCNLKFSVLLRHEFDMYVKLWPSILPIAGVWKTLYDLTQHDVPWLTTNDEGIGQTLHDVILRTPEAVRTIHNEHYSEVITDLIESFESNQNTIESILDCAESNRNCAESNRNCAESNRNCAESNRNCAESNRNCVDSNRNCAESNRKCIEKKILYATLLFLKAELQLAEASAKNGWKTAEPILDPDQTKSLRTMSTEHDAAKPALRAVDIWTDICTHINIHTVPISASLQHGARTAQVVVPLLLHIGWLGAGLQLAHCCCQIALYLGDSNSYVTNAGFIVYYANKQTDEITQLITTASQFCKELLTSDDSMETALVFLCDCALYYNKIGLTANSARLIQAVQARILRSEISERNLDLAVGRLFEAEVAVCSSGPSLLSGVIGIHRHYLAAGNSATKWSARRLRSLTLKLHISLAGLTCAGCARRMLARRRARCACAAALPAAGALTQARLLMQAADAGHAGLLLARDKIDNRIKYILGIQPSSDQPLSPPKNTKAPQTFTLKQDLETMLDNLTFKESLNSPSLDCLDRVPSFRYPDFLTHEPSCCCYACYNPFSFILACQIATLEASTYYRGNEFDVARNYFEGSLRCLDLAQNRLKNLKAIDGCEGYIGEIVERIVDEEFRVVRIESFIEAAFFELAQGNHKAADARIVTIHEILQEGNVDKYLTNEILNLMTTAARLRKFGMQKVGQCNLEVEFESLKLSPDKNIETPKTPEAKATKPPQMAKIKVSDEELPKTKRRVIELHLHDKSADEKDTGTKTRRARRTDFKIPVPVLPKPVLETMTPVTRGRRKPEIVVTQPSEDAPSTSTFEFVTPKPKTADKSEFFTPLDTPNEQFFTPMSTLKTYSKKTLRHGIVKNLESEFCTPKSELKSVQSKTEQPAKKTTNIDKENTQLNSEIPKAKGRKVETGSMKTLKEKKSLKRATSPGNLERDVRKPARPSRLRHPVKFSLDDGDK